MVAVPMKPVTGVKLTCPFESLENVPLFGTVNVVCTPGVLGSRSRVIGSRVAPVLAVSLAKAGRVTAVLNGVTLESGLAIGAGGGETVTVSSTGLLA